MSSIDISGFPLKNDSSFFRCLSPCSSLLSPHHFLSVRSNTPVFHGLSFCADSPVHLKSSTFFSTSCCSVKEKRLCDITSCSLNCNSHDDNPNIDFKTLGNELESETVFHTVEPSVFYPNHNFSLSSPFERPCDPRNQLSFCYPSGFQVMPHIPDSESFVGVDDDSDDMLHEPSQEKSITEEFVLHFRKILSRKRPKLAVFTETLFDIRRQEAESNRITGLLRPKEELEEFLSLTEQQVCDDPISTEPSASGRSRISKLQHEVLNNWFYSHLDHPYVAMFNS
jgi:hypothetical protein